ncbi:MAG: glycosyltransferase [Polyangiaceae bacterium]|nr:glycosyltransferase [Polyangiaceae bacterium]
MRSSGFCARCNKIGVCFVVNNFNVGGLEKVVLDLINNIDRDKFEPSVICIDGPGKIFDRVSLDDNACLVLDKSQSIKTPLGTFDPMSLWRMKQFFTKRCVKIVQAHNLGPLLFGGLSAHLGYQRPTMIYTEHNQFYSASPTARRKFIFYIRLADHVVAVSHDLQRTLAHRVKPTAPVHVIHNGIDGSRFDLGAGAVGRDEVRAELGVGGGEILLGAGVVLSKQKGLEYLLEAARTVISEEPRARFVLAGDGPLREQLERKAGELGLGDRFRFLGYRSDMHRVISALDVYVLSSLWEGLPLALLEALAMGKPIVATRVGGNPEVVLDGVNGFIVPPRDVGALSHALLQVCRHDGFRESVRNVNRERFETHFSLQAMVKAHEKLFFEVASERHNLFG